MSEQQSIDTSFKSVFKQQRENQVDKVLEEAQRIVNLYHHLEAFGDDFHAQLDDELMAMTPEVQAALPSILGGTIVRQYYEFLKEKCNPSGAASTDDSVEETAPVTQAGYLPPPDKDIPLASGIAGSAGIDVTALEALLQNFVRAHQFELERLLQAQTETLSQLVQRVDKNTHEVASHQTDRLIRALQREAGMHKQYSDVIESTATTTQAQHGPITPEETEGF